MNPAVPAALARFRIGDMVPQSGRYLCVPCGYTRCYQAGAMFETCPACYAGTGLGPPGYEDPASDFWQLLG